MAAEPWAVVALRTYVFHVIPMANPDGVVNGLGRLTSPQGADLVFWPATENSAHRAIVEATDRVRSKLNVTFHNWQNKHSDGLLGFDPHIRKRFLRFMRDQVALGKQ